MTKRIDYIQQRIQVSREANESFIPLELVCKCEEFLSKSLCEYLKPISCDRRSAQDKLTQLEFVNKISRRVARAIHADKIRRNAKLPDSDISWDEIQLYKRNQMLRLRDYAKNIIQILDTVTLPSSVNALTQEVTGLYITSTGTIGTKLAKKSLRKNLNDLILALDKHIPKKKILKKAKKGNTPFRIGIIISLAEAWIELIGKPPEKLKRNRNTGKPYGEFHNFMKNGLKLVGYHIGVEGAIKEAQKYYIEKLESANNQ